MKDRYLTPLRPTPSEDWPKVWRESYHYDLLEVWDDPEPRTLAGLAYANAYKARQSAVLNILVAEMPAPARVLDLAAAQGNFTIALAGLGYDVTWNDLRAELEGYVRQKLPKHTNAHFVSGNIFDMEEMYVGQFDAVFALEIIEHVAHPDDFISKLATLLRPGGVIVLSTPNGGYFLNKLPRFSDHPDPSVFENTQSAPNSDGHIFLLYEDEMRRFAKSSGLEVCDIKFLTNPLTAGHIKLRYALGVLPARTVDFLERFTRRLPVRMQRKLSSQLIVTLKKPAG